jgi:hypothetical protein
MHIIKWNTWVRIIRVAKAGGKSRSRSRSRSVLSQHSKIIVKGLRNHLLCYTNSNILLEKPKAIQDLVNRVAMILR